MSSTVTLFSHDDLRLMFQIGVALEFGAIAVFCVAALNAVRHRLDRHR